MTNILMKVFHDEYSYASKGLEFKYLLLGWKKDFSIVGDGSDI